MEDGSVKLKVGMDITDVNKGVDGIKDGCTRAGQAVERAGKTMGAALGRAVRGYDQSAMEFMADYEAGLDGDVRAMERNIDQIRQVGVELQEAGGEFAKRVQEAGANPLGTQQPVAEELTAAADKAGTLREQLASAERELQALSDRGLDVGDKDWDTAFSTVAQLRAELRAYLADLAKTPEQWQREEEAQAKVEARLAAVHQKERDRAEAIRQAAAAEQAEAQRLAEIARTAAVGNPQIVAMVQELDAAKARLADLSAAGLGAGYAEVDNLTVRVRELTAAIREYQANYKPQMDMTPWERFRAKLAEVSARARSTAAEVRGASKSTQSFGASLTRGVRKLVAYGVGINSVRVLASKLRSAIGEGLQILAQQDTQTAATLNSLRTSLSQVKASLATAFSPVLEAVAPLLSKLCSMLVTAANYVSMFFAIMGGKSTYKRVATGASGAAAGISTIGNAAAGAAKSVADMGTAAVASYGAMGSAVRVASVSTGELGENTAAAASGIRTIGQEAKKAERNLSGLDEMNIWKVKEESSSGGGGGSGGGGSGGSGGGLDVPGGGIQFEEVPIDPAFADRISWITDNLDHILTAVAAVGAGLLTWKVASGFGASLRKSAGLAMAVSGAILLGKGSLDAWTKGASWDRLGEQLAGTAGLVGGLGTAFGKTAGAYGGIVSGSFMVIAAFKEMIETGDMTMECFTEMEAGIAILGTALSLLTGSWIPAALAAILGLALAAAAYLGGDFSEQVEKEAHLMGIDAMEEGVRSAYETLRKSGASVVEAAEAVGVKAINTTASSADTAWKDWLPAFRRMGYSGSEAVAKGYYDSGMSLQESCIVAGIAGGMAYGTGVETGAEAGMKGMASSARRHTEAAANAMVEETKRAHRDTSAAFRHLREDGAEHVAGLEEDVEGAYSSMADTVSSDSSSMETDNDSSWSGMKELLLTMTGKMQDKVVSVYAAMGEKISTVMAAAKEKNSDAWTAMANTADKASGAMRGHVERAWGDIPQLAAEALDQAETTAEEKWTEMADATRSAGGEMKSAAASAWSGVAGAITAKVNELRNSASGWGRDICANLASGLQSGKSRVSSAASSVAGAIRSYLHFSVPDKGPLSDADEYGGDFMRLLSEEMTKNKGRAVSAARTVATAVSEQLGQVTAPGGVETRLGGLTDRLGELASALERLAAPLHGLTAQTPVLAAGTVLPPRAVYTEGPVRGLEDMGAGLRQLLGLEAGGGERRAEYTFIAQLDRRTLFKEVIAEGKLAQTRTGRNPFDLGG